MVIQKSTEALRRLFDRATGHVAPHRIATLLEFDAVEPGIFVGTCPRRAADASRLQTGPGITAVLNLQTDDDFERWDVDWAALEDSYMRLGMVVERLPIRDFDHDDLVRNLAGAAELLSRLLAVGHRTYVHCTAGRQRSPSVVAAFLVKGRGLTTVQAADRMRLARRCEPDMQALQQVFGADEGARAMTDRALEEG